MALDVDFTDVYYKAADGLQSFHSDKDNLTLNALSSGGTAYLTWYSDDGIGGGGTAGYEEDEWEFKISSQGTLGQRDFLNISTLGEGDVLNISFDNSVLLTEIHLTDFFIETRRGNTYAETGGVVFIGDNLSPLGGLHYFSQYDAFTSNGEYTIDVAGLIGPNAFVKDVYLAGIGKQNGEDHEFAVAGLNANPVPEPATMLLLGAGMFGLAGVGRKKILKK